MPWLCPGQASPARALLLRCPGARVEAVAELAQVSAPAGDAITRLFSQTTTVWFCELSQARALALEAAQPKPHRLPLCMHSLTACALYVRRQTLRCMSRAANPLAKQEDTVRRLSGAQRARQRTLYEQGYACGARHPGHGRSVRGASGWVLQQRRGLSLASVCSPRLEPYEAAAAVSLSGRAPNR